MSTTNFKSFVDYVLHFYGLNGIYPITALTRDEVQKAYFLLNARASVLSLTLVGDSTEREFIRDIVLHARGTPLNELEHGSNSLVVGIPERPVIVPVEFSVQAYCLRCKSTANVLIRTISDLAVFEIVPPSGWRVIFDDSAAVRFFLLCDCDRKEPQ